MATNIAPTTKMLRAIDFVMIKSPFSPLLRGRSSMTFQLGESEARAPAANVSIMRFTHSICVIVSGDSVPMSEPIITMRQAATLIVSWNRRKRWILR